MIAVIFEVQPQPGRRDRYLDIAAHLRPALESSDGFVSVERFQSLTDADKLLSLSFFADEHAVQRWRETEAHRCAQAQGRREVFADYRLRVAHVVRDYSLRDGRQAPVDSQRHHQSTTAHNRTSGDNR